ncbi:MAG: response regulator [Alphaproteobacteria bacterium]
MDAPKTQDSTPRTKGCEILIADDNPRARHWLGTILATSGHKITEAASGTEALDRILARHFHILITDLQMYPIDGYMLIDALKILPKSRQAPAVIVCSALVGDVHVDGRPELRSVVRLLTKPTRPAALIEAVEAASQAGTQTRFGRPPSVTFASRCRHGVQTPPSRAR